MPNQSSSSVFPVVALLLGATFWGVFWYPLRVLESYGLSGLWTTLLIYGTALSVSLIPLFWRGIGIRSHPAVLILLAVASGWTNIAFILAVLEGNVVRIMLLFYLSPLWTVILGRLILGEVMSRAAQITLLFALTGAVIMLWDPQVGLPLPQDRADWLAISAGFTFALSNVLIRKLRDEDIWIKTFFAWLGVVILAIVWLSVADQAWPEVSHTVLSLTVGLGGLAMIVMTLLVLYGLTHMPAHRAAVILLFELVAGAVSAQWLTDEVVLPQEWIGGVMILTAAYFAARRPASEQ